MQKIFGYWEVWHIVLAMILYMILYKFFDSKQVVFLLVMSTALMWEVSELFWNLKAYKDTRAFILNSYKDMLAALSGSLVCVILL